MRMTTTTLENGNVVAKAANKQRTVKATAEANINRRHAEAAKVLATAVGADTFPTCEVESSTRLVWQF